METIVFVILQFTVDMYTVKGHLGLDTLIAKKNQCGKQKIPTGLKGIYTHDSECKESNLSIS